MRAMRNMGYTLAEEIIVKKYLAILWAIVLATLAAPLIGLTYGVYMIPELWRDIYDANK